MLDKADFATLVPIKNMDRAVKFYTHTLGGKVLMRDTGDMKDMWASVKVGKEQFWLIQPEKQKKPDLAYSTFVVKDIRKTVAGLKKKGVKFDRAEKDSPQSKIEGSITHNPWGSSAFFRDSEQNLFMLWQNSSTM